MANHDAVSGNWTGEVDAEPAGWDGPGSYLGYLNSGTALQVLESAIFNYFSVAGHTGKAQATAFFRGAPLCTLERPSRDTLEQQLVWLRAYADLRVDRQAEIYTQIGDILSFFGSVGYLSGGRRKHSLRLLTATQDLAILVESQMKHYCRTARPMDLSSKIQPMIQTPDHSSFPSGHATEAFAVATVLHRLMTGETAREGVMAKAMPFRVAHRIATNRTVAGVHYPIDSLAGALLGCQLGDALYSLTARDHLTDTGLSESELENKFSKQDFFLSFTQEERDEADADKLALAALEDYMPEPCETQNGKVLDPIVSGAWNLAAIEWGGRPAFIEFTESEEKDAETAAQEEDAETATQEDAPDKDAEASE